jgi:RNA polymerase sigma-70 factor (ECF subfamily)
VGPDDEGDVTEAAPAGADHGEVLLALYDRSLPAVYGYLRPRCATVAAAEDLTSETFLAAVTAVERGKVETVTIGWLVGIARHKLVDHWRRAGREERSLRAVVDGDPVVVDDPWDAAIDAVRARAVLAGLGPHHRAALTLRYLDGLPVPEVAEVLGRTRHATEALIVRARAAFRVAYEAGEPGEEER